MSVSMLSIGIGAATPVNVVNLSIALRLSAYPRFRLATGARNGPLWFPVGSSKSRFVGQWRPNS
jgi:hypothetical protein